MNSNFIKFLRVPRHFYSATDTLWAKMKTIGTLFLLKILLIITMITIGFFLENQFNIYVPKRIRNPETADVPIFIKFLKSVLAAPIFEELLFRLPLKFSAINFTMLFSLSAFLVFYFLKFDISIVLSCSLVVGAISYFIISRNVIKSLTSNYYEKNINYIFYFLSLYFAFVHIRVFDLDINTYVWAPFILFPYFFSALIYGYIRMRYGVIESILMHILHNLLLFSLIRI